MLNAKIQKLLTDGLRFIQIVENVLAKCGMDEMRIFTGIARKIWLRRNDVVHGGNLPILTFCYRELFVPWKSSP